MSMNCPKCGFYQPEDQYCASCGVDMKKYQPKEIPVWRRVLGNWIFQLGVLILVVMVLIVSDNMSSEKRIITDRSVPLSAPVKRSSSRGANGKVLPPSVEKGAPPVAPPPMPGSSPNASTLSKPVVKDGLSAAPATGSPENVSGTVALVQKKLKKDQRKRPVESSALSMERTVASYFYLVSRGAFEALVSAKGNAVEDGVTLIKSRDFGKELKIRRSEWKKLGSQRQSFEFGKSKLIFVGTSAGDSNSKVGYYIRGRVYPPEEGQKINVELRTWSELKPGEESVGGPGTAIELQTNEIILVSNIVPRDLSFSDSERSFFEGHPALRALNDPQYIEENLELVLVLQYK